MLIFSVVFHMTRIKEAKLKIYRGLDKFKMLFYNVTEYKLYSSKLACHNTYTPFSNIQSQWKRLQ